MRYRNAIVTAATAAATLLPLRAMPSQGIERRVPPYLVAAGSAGAAGFTNGGSSQLLLGGYAYAAWPRLILGAQGGGTPGGSAPDLLYGMATLGYPAHSVKESLVYPFVGVGGGVVHGDMVPRTSGMVFGAGVGADHMLVDVGGSILVGLRGGYVMRPSDAGGRAVYLNLAIGLAGSRTVREEPPVIVAARGPK